MLTEELEYYGGGSLQFQFDEAYKDFIGHCRSRKLDHSQPPFKVSKVVYPFEITMNAKAWNGRVVCAWLAETLPLAAQAFDRGHDGGRVTLTCHALKCMSRFFWLLETNPRELLLD
ncbi:unnamed protein product [Durusdinium trenchii]|uniref:Uncharacterized protein n=2 Tax=Durusdinium trenchii TaxID=1381693 RepID=A0ABP0LIX6_9DINO